MDRTVIGPWKAEEKDLSEKLYKKLSGLTLLHPPTEEFRKCVNEDMFLKPNQQAFFHVMHYLFKLHDPIEFRKRFYWPITDKKAEANFRSSTIEYLKYLDERHDLHWTNIKSYLVQMPGGMKFINFLLDLVSFVISEQIKSREKFLNNDVEEVTDLTIKRLIYQNNLYKVASSEYICNADELIASLQEKTALLIKSIQYISNASSMQLKVLLEDSFEKQFEASNRKIFQKLHVGPAERICFLQRPFAALKEAFDLFQSKKNEFQIDRDALRKSLQKIHQLHSEDFYVADEEFPTAPYDETIKIDTLIAAFNVIYKSIEEYLIAANNKPLSRKFVTDELNALQSELQQIDSQITDFQKKINSELKKRTCVKDLLERQEKTPIRTIIGSDNCLFPKGPNKENSFLMKFVATPPIKIEMLEGNQKTNTRLPLLDDLSFNIERSMVADAKAGIDSLNNLLALPRSVRKPKIADISIDLNNTVNKSKIIDPMQLLRTINRDKGIPSKIPSQYERSKLDFNWKERQSTFGKDIESSPRPTMSENNNEKRCNISISEQNEEKASCKKAIPSPLTPLSCNERTHIGRTQQNDTNVVGNAGNLLFTKKLSAVKKVQDASLHFHNLSTSPSGRLDPLVTLEDKDLPKLLLNDMTMHEFLSESETNSNVTTGTAYSTLKKKSPKLQKNVKTKTASNVSDHFKFLSKADQFENNDIRDISDSVLKDTTM